MCYYKLDPIRLSILLYLSCSLYAKTKPIEGRVISDSDKYLSDVSIVSLPSSISTKTNTEGGFYLDIPINDKKIAFYLKGYIPDTSNAVLFKNESEIVLIKIIEVNYLDSVDTKIRFVLSRDGENINIYGKDGMSSKGVFSTQDMIRQDNSIVSYFNHINESDFYVRGSDYRDMNKLYNNLRVDYLHHPLTNISLIGNGGLSELIITRGGFNKIIASSGLMNFIPEIDYNNALYINAQGSQRNENNIDGFVSLGSKYATINGGSSQSDDYLFPVSDTLNAIITRTNKRVFSNIGITNKRNLEIIVTGVQNKNSYFNPIHSDTTDIINNNLMIKVDQWNPFTGRISLFGLNQNLSAFHNNSLASLNKNDRCSTLGFLFEKDINNFLFTFSTTSTIINADWSIGTKRIQTERQNSLFTGSTQIFFNKRKEGLYFKDLKIVYSKERTADVTDTSSSIDIKANYWDNNSFQINTSIIDPNNVDRVVHLTVGNVYSAPNIDNTLKGVSPISPFVDSLDVLPQQHSSIDLGLSIKKRFEKYNWSYSLDFDFFDNFYKEKRIHIPVLGGYNTYPKNIGDVRLSGTVFHFQLEPYIRRFKFSTDISSHYSDDLSKFQFLSKNVINNQVLFINKFFNLSIRVSSYGKRSFSALDKDSGLLYYELKPFRDYSIRLSKQFIVKWFTITLSLSGVNLKNQVIEIGDLKTNERKYLLNMNFTFK